jgi:hypothetical protein
MCPISSRINQDEEQLSQLAMKFRGTRLEADRRKIASDYGDTVNRLIASAKWQQMPPSEDQLPEVWMPKAFFEYWSPRHKATQP